MLCLFDISPLLHSSSYRLLGFSDYGTFSGMHGRIEENEELDEHHDGASSTTTDLSVKGAYPFKVYSTIIHFYKRMMIYNNLSQDKFQEIKHITTTVKAIEKVKDAITSLTGDHLDRLGRVRFEFSTAILVQDGISASTCKQRVLDLKNKIFSNNTALAQYIGYQVRGILLKRFLLTLFISFFTLFLFLYQRMFQDAIFIKISDWKKALQSIDNYIKIADFASLHRKQITTRAAHQLRYLQNMLGVTSERISRVVNARRSDIWDEAAMEEFPDIESVWQVQYYFVAENKEEYNRACFIRDNACWRKPQRSKWTLAAPRGSGQTKGRDSPLELLQFILNQVKNKYGDRRKVTRVEFATIFYVKKEGHEGPKPNIEINLTLRA